MIIIDCEQGSPEWHAARCGNVTASRIGDMLSRTKSGWAASRMNYRSELVVERLAGVQEQGFVSAPMQWGKDHEAEAADTYSLIKGQDIEVVGLVRHQTIECALASPDRLVGDHGLLEIKCPNTATHIAFLLSEDIPREYQLQMYWQMACTGRRWCDYASYDPRLPPEMQLHTVRLEADDKLISILESDVCEFLSEVDEEEQALREKFAA